MYSSVVILLSVYGSAVHDVGLVDHRVSKSTVMMVLKGWLNVVLLVLVCRR
jgi:hypothetical protein